MVKTDIGIITIAVERRPHGLTTGFRRHFQCFHGEPAVRRERHGPAHWFSCEQVENNGEVRPALTRPDRSHHRTTPDLVPLRRTVAQDDSDSNVLMTATLIPVKSAAGRLAGQLFHESAASQRPLVTSLGCDCGDARSAEPWRRRSVQVPDCEDSPSAVWLFRTVFPVFAAAMNPEHMARVHRITRPRSHYENCSGV